MCSAGAGEHGTTVPPAHKPQTPLYRSFDLWGAAGLDIQQAERQQPWDTEGLLTASVCKRRQGNAPSAGWGSWGRAKGIIFKSEKRNMNTACEAGTSCLKLPLIRQRDRKWSIPFPGRTVRPGGTFRKTKSGI